jgi:putative FmdB family regulatory protein
MALYEYRCRACDTTFDLRRPMAEANAPASCPEGHPGAVRLLSVFASVGSGTASDAGAHNAPAVPCGAHCACHPG